MDTPARKMSGMVSQFRLGVEAHILDELRCVQWCADKGLIRQAHDCRKHRKARRLVRHSGVDGVRWYCGKCDKGDSALVGSVFEMVHMPLGRAVMLIHCFAWGLTYEQAKLATQLNAEDIELSNHTIADWYGKLRDRLVDCAADDAGGQIGGPEMIVQIDEALIGRRKYHKGRVVEETWVVGLIDTAGELRLTVVENRSAKSLLAVVRKYVKRGSEIHTDGWRGYNRLGEFGYTHKRVIHEHEFVAEDGTHTQRIESQWRNVRRTFSRGGIRHEDIGEHLVEHVWRRQCRRANKDPFLELLKYLQYEG